MPVNDAIVGQDYTAIVTVTDTQSGVNTASLTAAAFAITDPSGSPVTPQAPVITGSTGAGLVTASLTFPTNEEGQYPINLIAGQISDVTGNTANAVLLTTVNAVSAPADYSTPKIDIIEAAYPASNIVGQLRIDKKRSDSDPDGNPRLELLVHTPLSSDGVTYGSTLLTNRFGGATGGLTGEPWVSFEFASSLGSTTTETDIAPVSANNSAPYAQAATFTEVSSATATESGTWTAADAEDIRRSTTVGDYLEYTFTVPASGQTILHKFRNVGGNGSILEYTITGGPVAQWYRPDDGGQRLINTSTAGSAQAQSRYWVPIARLDAGTYTLRVTVSAAVGTITARVGGLRFFGSIPYNLTGTIGTGIVSGAQTTLYWPGSRHFYQQALTAGQDLAWVVFARSDGGEARVTTYDNAGTVVNTQVVDTNNLPLNNVLNEISLITSATAGTYYVEVESLTPSAPLPARTLIRDGGLKTTEVTAADIATTAPTIPGFNPDSFLLSAPGTYVYSGSGNIHSFPQICLPGEDPATALFVTGVHEYSRTTGITIRVDGVDVGYMAAPDESSWVGDSIEMSFVSDVFFPSTASTGTQVRWCVFTHTVTFTKAGISSTVQYVTDADARVTNLYATAVQGPNRVPAETFADDVGGGFERVILEHQPEIILNDYNNRPQTVNGSTTPTAGLIMYNNTLARWGKVTNLEAINNQFIGLGNASTPRAFAVLRADAECKAYIRAFPADVNAGTIVPAGTTLIMNTQHRTVLGTNFPVLLT